MHTCATESYGRDLAGNREIACRDSALLDMVGSVRAEQSRAEQSRANHSLLLVSSPEGRGLRNIFRNPRQSCFPALFPRKTKCLFAMTLPDFSSERGAERHVRSLSARPGIGHSQAFAPGKTGKASVHAHEAFPRSAFLHGHFPEKEPLPEKHPISIQKTR